MTEVAEEVGADAGELFGVKTAFDELPGVFAAALAFIPLGAAFADGGGEFFWGEVVNRPAGVGVEDFAQAAEEAADDGQAAGHGFGDDIGDDVAVAVGRDDAGHAEAAGLLDMLADFFWWQDAGPSDNAVELKVFSLRSQRFFQRAGADDGQVDIAVLLFEEAKGVEEDGDTLFGDEAANEEQTSGAVVRAFALEGPFIEQDAVVENIETILVAGTAISESLSGGLIADGNKGGGTEEPSPGVFTGMDIKGVDADAVADAEILGDIGGQQGGQIGEFGVDVANALVPTFGQQACA